MAAALERKQEGEQFRVLDPANLPDKPAFRTVHFCFGRTGRRAGAGTWPRVSLEMRDTSMRTERDVEFALRLPVLAMVPAIGPMTAKATKETPSQLDRNRAWDWEREPRENMYQRFFGLRESPFNVNPDPRYLFLTRQIQEALAGLTYGIQNRKASSC